MFVNYEDTTAYTQAYLYPRCPWHYYRHQLSSFLHPLAPVPAPAPPLTQQIKVCSTAFWNPMRAIYLHTSFNVRPLGRQGVVAAWSPCWLVMLQLKLSRAYHVGLVQPLRFTWYLSSQRLIVQTIFGSEKLFDSTWNEHKPGVWMECWEVSIFESRDSIPCNTCEGDPPEKCCVGFPFFFSIICRCSRYPPWYSAVLNNWSLRRKMAPPLTQNGYDSSSTFTER